MIDLGKHSVLGVKVDAIDYEGAVLRILAAAKDRRPLAVSALAVHGIMTGVLDRTHRYRLNALDVVTPDGQPVRWALNLFYKTGLTDRTYGPSLMLKACGRAADEGLPIFLFGGKNETLERLRANLLAQFPSLLIAGQRPSAFRTLTPTERDELVNEVRESGAKLAFVGIGCPRQEVFAYEMRNALSMPILAVGAAFSFHAGDTRGAPDWMQRHGLEWLFRLTRDPIRLWRRYVLLNPLYAMLIVLQGLQLYAIRPDDVRRPVEDVLYG